METAVPSNTRNGVSAKSNAEVVDSSLKWDIGMHSTKSDAGDVLLSMQTAAALSRM